MKQGKRHFDLIGGRSGLIVVYAVGLTVILLQLRSLM